MSLSVNKTIQIDREEEQKIELKREAFEEKYSYPNYQNAEEGREKADKAFDGWMKRTYGYSGYMITGSNNQRTLNLGNWIK